MATERRPTLTDEVHRGFGSDDTIAAIDVD
jgi:hypothetical protein